MTWCFGVLVSVQEERSGGVLFEMSRYYRKKVAVVKFGMNS